MRSDRIPEKPRILIATTEIPAGLAVERQLALDGYLVERIHDSKGVLRLMGRQPFDVIVLDMALGEEGNVDLISYARRRSLASQLILLCDVGKIERAIEGVRRGAFFYLPRTSQPSDVALVIGKAVRARGAEAVAQRYEQELFAETIGETKAMKRVVELITKVAPTDSTVLLLGESGTGKEVLANTIHQLSARRDMPFIAINCAALPDQLLESEMFGHVKGAFTGADADKKGLFEEADGGTIFLDEIGDMALVTQAKLLRVLQNGEIRRVGASVSGRVDVRVIAATHHDLEKAVETRAFREDLYFRLNVIQIRIPPLRERMDALPKLARHFTARFAKQYGKPAQGLDEASQALLRNYDYPGNVRELQSILEHAVIMSEGELIHAHDLPDRVQHGSSPRLALPDYASNSLPTIVDMEAQLIRTALDRLNNNQTEAAKRLGISRSTLWRKMKEYGIQV
ncbi:MAG TPA: sigma-54 dependent transcriptional regulator [Candidatus Hydrogenedentes bacterium]|nr:sigma-54 dependent transcriptional regulator [Candidatus Hydrogenedentota bacterium]